MYVYINIHAGTATDDAAAETSAVPSHEPAGLPPAAQGSGAAAEPAIPCPEAPLSQQAETQPAAERVYQRCLHAPPKSTGWAFSC